MSRSTVCVKFREDLLECYLRHHLYHCDWPAENAAASQARRMVREADTNGDGKVSREEFVELLQDTNVPDSLEHYDSRLSIAAS